VKEAQWHPVCGAGAIQLALTIIGLWTFGLHIARALRFPALSVAFVYIIPGLVASMASANLSTHYTAAVAPAAVCGLIGESHLWGDGNLNVKHGLSSGIMSLGNCHALSWQHERRSWLQRFTLSMTSSICINGQQVTWFDEGLNCALSLYTNHYQVARTQACQ